MKIVKYAKYVGPVSRHLTAQILPQMCLASRTSRLGLAVGLSRVFCNGMCTAQRLLYFEGEEQRCRAGCQDEPDSLSHYKECPLLYNFFTSVWRHSLIQPRRAHLLHDLVTQIFLRRLQYGIVVMGIIDSFVYAHNHHRRNLDNPRNFRDCMEGRIRFMTAITPAYAHAYQTSCLTRHPIVIPHQKFRLPAAKARYPHLPNSGTTTRERGNDFQGWAMCTDGGTRSANGETFAGWCVVGRAPHGRIYHVWSCHHNGSASPRMQGAEPTPTTQLSCLPLSKRSRMSTPSIASTVKATLYHAAALGTFFWCRTKTFPHVGRIPRWFPIRALLLVTTSSKIWTNNVMLEQRAHLLFLFRTVFLRGCLGLSVSDCDVSFKLFGSVDAYTFDGRRP